LWSQQQKLVALDLANYIPGRDQQFDGTKKFAYDVSIFEGKLAVSMARVDNPVSLFFFFFYCRVNINLHKVNI
jgi:hypothetical protein